MDDGEFCGEVGFWGVGGCPELEADGADDVEGFGHGFGFVDEDVLSMVVGRLVDGNGLGVLVHERHYGVAGIVGEVVGCRLSALGPHPTPLPLSGRGDIDVCIASLARASFSMRKGRGTPCGLAALARVPLASRRGGGTVKREHAVAVDGVGFAVGVEIEVGVSGFW